MSKVTRIGVTFPPDLLKDFDEIISKMGYESRSKAIQDAVRLYVSDRKWLKETDTIQTGVILMVYDHDAKNLESELGRTKSELKNVTILMINKDSMDFDFITDYKILNQYVKKYFKNRQSYPNF